MKTKQPQNDTGVCEENEKIGHQVRTEDGSSLFFPPPPSPSPPKYRQRRVTRPSSDWLHSLRSFDRSFTSFVAVSFFPPLSNSINEGRERRRALLYKSKLTRKAMRFVVRPTNCAREWKEEKRTANSFGKVGRNQTTANGRTNVGRSVSRSVGRSAQTAVAKQICSSSLFAPLAVLICSPLNRAWTMEQIEPTAIFSLRDFELLST